MKNTIQRAAVAAMTLAFLSGTHLTAEEKSPAAHDHAQTMTGPNGGRVLHAVEPHLEFFVTKDRKVRITVLDSKGKGIPATTQSVSVMAGDRSKPTRLTFEGKDGVLVSDKALPEGNDFPVVVMIKPAPDQKSVIEKFNVNLADCPTCEYAEYACTCDH